MRSIMLSKVGRPAALVALCVGSFGWSATGQEPGTADKVPTSERRAAERKATTGNPRRESLTAQQFAQKAAVGGQKEVQLSQIALQKSQNAEVRAFAQQMVQDHTAVGRQLGQIAVAKGIQLPATNALETALLQTSRTPTGRSDKLLPRSEIPEADLDAVRKLEKLTGEEFDRAYVKEMAKDHEKTISKFEQASKSLDDPELKQFAADTLPKLRHHGQQAEQLSATVGKKQ